MNEVGEHAKSSSYHLAKASTEQKNIFLNDLSQRINDNKQKIFEANNNDIENAKKVTLMMLL